MKEAQQFCLQAQLHFTYFIEKKRAAIGLARSACPVRNRSGKSTFEVSKDFRFHQIFWDGSTVQRHKCFGATGRAHMNGFCAQLFTRAAFTCDEDRCLGGRDTINCCVNILHRRRTADKAKVFCVCIACF